MWMGQTIIFEQVLFGMWLWAIGWIVREQQAHLSTLHKSPKFEKSLLASSLVPAAAETSAGCWLVKALYFSSVLFLQCPQVKYRPVSMQVQPSRVTWPSRALQWRPSSKSAGQVMAPVSPPSVTAYRTQSQASAGTQASLTTGTFHSPS